MATARPAQGGTSRFPWRVAAACLLVGLALSIAGVPAAAFVSQRWGAFSSGSSMIGDMHRLPDGGVYFLPEHHAPATSTGGRTSGGGRGVLMRLRASTRAAPSYAQQFLEGPNELEPLAEDPRPAFLRPPPPEGYTTVEAVSAGWPWHAAHGLRYRARGNPSLDRGLVALPLGRSGDVLPVLPIWTGLLGNTLLYGGTLLLAWWLLRGRRVARRRARGECLACGYTLDAGMERCPECGVASRQSAAT
jgi:hypothetical protein